MDTEQQGETQLGKRKQDTAGIADDSEGGATQKLKHTHGELPSQQPNGIANSVTHFLPFLDYSKASTNELDSAKVTYMVPTPFPLIQMPSLMSLLYLGKELALQDTQCVSVKMNYEEGHMRLHLRMPNNAAILDILRRVQEKYDILMISDTRDLRFLYATVKVYFVLFPWNMVVLSADLYTATQKEYLKSMEIMRKQRSNSIRREFNLKPGTHMGNMMPTPAQVGKYHMDLHPSVFPSLLSQKEIASNLQEVYLSSCALTTPWPYYTSTDVNSYAGSMLPCDFADEVVLSPTKDSCHLFTHGDEVISGELKMLVIAARWKEIHASWGLAKWGEKLF